MADRIPGEFVPLDVNYSHDRAIRQAGPMAELLFIRSLAYARKMRSVTGGLIPDYDLLTVAAGIPNPKRHVKALIDQRLWVIAKGGWRIRSFEKWNPEPDRAAQGLGGRIGNHNRWHTDGRWSPDCEFCTPPEGGIGTESVTDHSTDEKRSLPTDRLVIASVSLPIAEVEKREERETKTSVETKSKSSSDVTRGDSADVLDLAARRNGGTR